MRRWTRRRWDETRLFGADGEDLFALDFDFDAEGRANVGALDNGAANPDVAWEVDGAEGIVEGSAAGIADEGMIGTAIAILGAEPVQIGDVLELTTAVRSLTGVGKITRNGGGRAGRQANDCCGDTFTGEPIANEEVQGRPWFRKVADVGNGGVGLIGVRQERVGVGSGRGNFDLRSRLRVRGLLWPGAGEPADSEEKAQAEDSESNDERQDRSGWTRAAGCGRDAGNLRHVGFKALR